MSQAENANALYRLILPLWSRLQKDFEPGYWTSTIGLKMAIAPIEGMPEKHVIILDDHKRYVLKIWEKNDTLSASLEDKDYKVMMEEGNVAGHYYIIEKAFEFFKELWDLCNKETFALDGVANQLVLDAQKPKPLKTAQQVFSDWIKSNISSLFTGGNGNMKASSIEEFLSSIIGLDEVKEILRRFLAILEFSQKTEGMLKIQKPNLHMVLKGPAGTGKTMMANKLAQLYDELDLIKAPNGIPKVSMINGASLLTDDGALKVHKVVEQAAGGVLLIDEAYSITESAKGVGDEVIAQLLTEMEDNKDRMAIIFAGYTEKMTKFLSNNPGLRSRVGANVTLSNYTPDQLQDMLIRKLIGSGFDVEDPARVAMLAILTEAARYQDFGNGRFVERFYEDIVAEHAFRVKGVTDEAVLSTIIDKDVTHKVIDTTLQRGNLL